MKKLALSVFLLALAPLQAKAFIPVNEQTDLLSYVAMPIAVSSVCDVRGVQTDRVGELVTYLDQANVPPAEFDDVFRYVPVALVMRTDRRPDFVEWVHGEVNQGIVGPALVTAMEQQLGTYGSGITVVSHRVPTRYRYRHHHRYAYTDYNNYGYDNYDNYAYNDVFAEDYVPVVVRHYCEREFAEPMALIDMPVAVTDVYGLGLPVQRVSSFAVELNIGGVPPVQFVELMRYAPAALVVDTAYAPDLVTYVHTQEVGGVYGLPLVQAIDQQFPAYGVNAQVDLTSPGYYYSPDNYYVPTYAPTAPQYQARYYVPPVDPAYVPPVVQTRVASGFAAGGANYALPQQTAPAIAAAPQVQRLLNAPNGAAVVTNPAQARREIAQQARAARAARLAPVPAPVFGQSQAAPMMAAAHGRGHDIAARPPLPVQASPTAQMMRGVGRGRHVGTAGVAPAPMMAAPVHGNGHGRGRAVAAAPSFAQPQPQPQFHGNGHGRGRAVAAAPQFAQPAPQPQFHGNGHGRGRAVSAAPVMAAPRPVMQAPPQPQFHGNGNGHGRGHQQAMPMMAPPQPRPAPVMAAPRPVMPAPQMIQHGNGGGHVPPGQEKKGKGH